MEVMGPADLVLALNDALIQAISRLVDDWQNPREPSHSDIGSAREGRTR
jgi:hypothetical protein